MFDLTRKQRLFSAEKDVQESRINGRCFCLKGSELILAIFHILVRNWFCRKFCAKCVGWSHCIENYINLMASRHWWLCDSTQVYIFVLCNSTKDTNYYNAYFKIVKNDTSPYFSEVKNHSHLNSSLKFPSITCLYIHHLILLPS